MGRPYSVPSVRKFFIACRNEDWKGFAIHMWANFFEPTGILIGEDTIIGDHAFLDGRAPLIIGKHVDIASSVMIYNSEHDLEKEDFSAKLEPVK